MPILACAYCAAHFAKTFYVRTARSEDKFYYPMQDNSIFHGNFPQRFREADECLNYLFEMQSENIRCPKCGRSGSYYFHRHPSKLCYTCNCGKYHFYPLKGTIFAKTSMPLPKWFYGIFLMSEKSRGISGKELQRQLGVSYGTAWRMRQRILSVKPSAVWRRGRSSVFNAYLKNSTMHK